ncbi:glycosyltransferase family 39 protein [bacterium]|nr:glycosyltransferase family 39 protein [bacterium]
MDALKNKYWIIILFLFAILMIFSRLHTLHEPLDVDTGVYSYVANQMISGDKLYTDIIDIKPPGIFLVNILGQLIWGYSSTTVVYLGIMFCLISMLFLFLILRKTTNLFIALLGCFFWVLSSNSISLQATPPNSETYINTFILIAVWAMIRTFKEKGTYLWIAGIALALATLIKMNVAFIALALCLVLFLSVRKETETKWLKEGSINSAKILLPCFVMWAIVIAYFTIQHRFGDFYAVQFKSLTSYAGNVLLNELRFFTNYHSIFDSSLKDISVITVLAFLNLIWSIRKRQSNEHICAAFYLLGSLIMVASMFRGRGTMHAYYYVIILPPVIINAVYFINDLYQINKIKPLARIICVVSVLFLALGSLVYSQVRYLSMTPEQISQEKFSNGMIAAKKLGEILGRITTPDEYIYQMGGVSSIYIYSKRKAASGLVNDHIASLPTGELAIEYGNKIINEVIFNKAAFFIMPGWSGTIHEYRYFLSLKEHYKYFGAFYGMAIFERKGRDRVNDDFLDQFRTMHRWQGKPWDEMRLHLKEYKSDVQITRKRVLANSSVGPKKYVELINGGNTAAYNGDWKTAYDKWTEALYLFPNRPESHGNLGIYFEKSGHFYMALKEFEKAGRVLNEPWESYYREVYEKLKAQAAEATDVLTLSKHVQKMRRMLVNAFGNDEYSMLMKKGFNLLQKGKVRETISIWEKAKKMEPKRPEAWANLGVLYEQRRLFEKALKCYEFAAEKLGDPWNKYYEELKQFLDEI